MRVKDVKPIIDRFFDINPESELVVETYKDFGEYYSILGIEQQYGLDMDDGVYTNLQKEQRYDDLEIDGVSLIVIRV